MGVSHAHGDGFVRRRRWFVAVADARSNRSGCARGARNCDSADAHAGRNRDADGRAEREADAGCHDNADTGTDGRNGCPDANRNADADAGSHADTGCDGDADTRFDRGIAFNADLVHRDESNHNVYGAATELEWNVLRGVEQCRNRDGFDQRRPDVHGHGRRGRNGNDHHQRRRRQDDTYQRDGHDDHLRSELMSAPGLLTRYGAISLVTALAACSGSGGSHSGLGLVPAAPLAPAAKTRATATFTITVPPHTASSSNLRSVQFISPNTNSIKIETLNPDGSMPVPAIAPTVAQLTAGAPGCVSGTSGVVCTVSAPVAAGNEQFRLSVYASTDASGTALGVGTITTLVAAGQANLIPVTLGGVIASLAFATPRVSEPADGATHQIGLTLSAKDASGALIIAPGDFYTGVTVAKTNDPNNALTLGATAVVTPTANGLNMIAVTYDAGKTLVDGTITASVPSMSGAPNVTAVTADITPLVYTLSPQGASLVAGAATPSLTLTVSEALTAGPFTATASPASTVQIAGSGTAGSPGGNATFTLTGGSSGGPATIAVADGTVSGTVTVSVTGTGVGVNVPGQPTVTEFGGTGANPNDITTGSDGNLWFVETTAGKIGTMSTSGALLHEYAVSTGYSPVRITAGPDRNLWFSESDRNHNSKIGRITTSGTVTEFAVPTTGAHAIGITTGPDGNLWFTEEDANKIGTITTAGTVTAEYPSPMSSVAITSPRDLTVGSDGALWFTEFNYKVNPAVRKIGRITTAGTVSDFPVNTAAPTALAIEQPASITTGADGNVWFTEYDPNGVNTTVDIGKMTTTGAVTLYTAALTPGLNPDGIKLLRDGNMWFTESSDDNTIGRIGRITSLGTIVEFSRGITQGGDPAGLTSGSDGNVWFTEYSLNSIGRLQF